MNKTLPDKIKIRFTAQDRKTSGAYGDSRNCILATALKRMGFDRVMIGGWGDSFIGSTKYRPMRTFSSGRLLGDKGVYLPSVVGKRVTLLKVRGS